MLSSFVFLGTMPFKSLQEITLCLEILYSGSNGHRQVRTRSFKDSKLCTLSQRNLLFRLPLQLYCGYIIPSISQHVEHELRIDCMPFYFVLAISC